MADPITLSIAEFAPDRAPTDPTSSDNIVNVSPRTKDSYGPFSDMAPFSSALAARCQGAAGFTDSSGNINVFAGVATNLYQLSSANATWTNVSKSAGAYNCLSDELWSQALFGARVLFANISDPIQSFVLGSSSAFADLAAAAPKCRYLAVVKNFLVAANTYDASGGFQTQRVWWSALNDPTNWPTPGTASAAIVQSDYNDLPGDMGWIQGIVGNLGTADGAIFFERGVWRMVYNGPPNIFYFFPAEGVRGTPAPRSIVRLGSVAFYLGRDGFYVFDGTNSKPIGVNRVDKWFYTNVDKNYIGRVCGVADPINNQIIWSWPDGNASNGNPNNMLVYNWVIDRWTWVQLNTEFLLSLLTFGYTLDTMDPFGTLDGMPQFPFDSRVWTGGSDALAAFDSSNKLNFFNGDALAATVDFSEQNLFPGRLALIKNSRPLADGGTPSIAIGVRNRLVDTPTFNAGTAMNSIGTCPQRASGRYTRARMTMPAGDSWSHISGCEIEANQIGVR